MQAHRPTAAFRSWRHILLTMSSEEENSSELTWSQMLTHTQVSNLKHLSSVASNVNVVSLQRCNKRETNQEHLIWIRAETIHKIETSKIRSVLTTNHVLWIMSNQECPVFSPHVAVPIFRPLTAPIPMITLHVTP